MEKESSKKTSENKNKIAVKKETPKAKYRGRSKWIKIDFYIWKSKKRYSKRRS